MSSKQETVAGRTNSVEFNRVMPAVYPLILWALCRQLLEGASLPYVDGFVDGAFALLMVRAVALVFRSYREEGGSALAEARKGVLVGTLCALAAIMVVTLAVLSARL